MNILTVFARNLKKYRNIKKMSQGKLAKKTGLHRTYISAVECERRNISINNVQHIADALEIDTYLLFINDDEWRSENE